LIGFGIKLHNRCSANGKFPFHRVSAAGEGKETLFFLLRLSLVLFKDMNQNIRKGKENINKLILGK